MEEQKQLRKQLETCKRIRKRTGYKGKCKDCIKIENKLFGVKDEN